MAPDLQRYLLPVRDLTVTREWVVGRVRFLPAGGDAAAVAQFQDADGEVPYSLNCGDNIAGRVFGTLAVGSFWLLSLEPPSYC